VDFNCGLKPEHYSTDGATLLFNIFLTLHDRSWSEGNKFKSPPTGGWLVGGGGPKFIFCSHVDFNKTRLGECLNDRPQKSKKIFPHRGPSLYPYTPHLPYLLTSFLCRNFQQAYVLAMFHSLFLLLVEEMNERTDRKSVV
jgi:hypothetical protein